MKKSLDIQIQFMESILS